MRIGHGYDVHRLVPGRDLILGGVRLDYHLGLDGHSDADVLTHAVMDARWALPVSGTSAATFRTATRPIKVSTVRSSWPMCGSCWLPAVCGWRIST